MRVNASAIAKAVVILVVLTVLPVVGQRFLPTELYKALSIQMGLKVTDLLNRVALIGAALSILVLVRVHLRKPSGRYLAVSTVWKVFWLIMVFFALGIGYPETLGQAILGGKSDTAENTVVFDLRLIAALATVIVILMVVRSVVQFREADSETSQEPKSETDNLGEKAPYGRGEMGNLLARTGR